MSRILVVEDDDQMRAILKQILERAGHEVAEAANGRAAMEMQRRACADLVITDIIMPEMDGIEMITALRRDFPAVKIIAISGGSRIGPMEFLSLARVLGAHRTLHKPFALQDMLDAVDELLGRDPSGSPCPGVPS